MKIILDTPVPAPDHIDPLFAIIVTVVLFAVWAVVMVVQDWRS